MRIFKNSHLLRALFNLVLLFIEINTVLFVFYVLILTLIFYEVIYLYSRQKLEILNSERKCGRERESIIIASHAKRRKEMVGGGFGIKNESCVVFEELCLLCHVFTL